jgi:hypothetical protein
MSALITFSTPVLCTVNSQWMTSCSPSQWLTEGYYLPLIPFIKILTILGLWLFCEKYSYFESSLDILSKFIFLHRFFTFQNKQVPYFQNYDIVNKDTQVREDDLAVDVGNCYFYTYNRGTMFGLTLSDATSNLVRQYDFPVSLRCRKTSDTVFVAFVPPLSEPVRRFSSCSTDFSQQIAHVVLFLYLHVFFF